MGRIGILVTVLWLAMGISFETAGRAQDVAVPEVPVPSEADLQRVQAEHDGEVRFCLTRERSLTPRASGVVVLETGIDTGGRAVTPTVVSSTFAATGVIAECLRGAVGRWTFPIPRDPAARFTLTF